MKEKEKQLFKALCKFKGSFTDAFLIEFATPAVLGYLFFNRMQGIAYMRDCFDCIMPDESICLSCINFNGRSRDAPDGSCHYGK